MDFNWEVCIVYDVCYMCSTSISMQWLVPLHGFSFTKVFAATVPEPSGRHVYICSCNGVFQLIYKTANLRLPLNQGLIVPKTLSWNVANNSTT